MIQARQHFPGLLDKTFLDAACVSLAPRPAVEAIEKFLDSGDGLSAGVVDTPSHFHG